ncbi:deoxyuridine 5'-triphosphate nucleotidohydrolase [Spirochaetia bacterium]|nr:deoxyuridine 5'-triphosphate nucleotidohydrolase [Spirochaetia bacterium]
MKGPGAINRIEKPVRVNIRKKSAEVTLPRYETEGAAGLDVRAYLPEAEQKIAAGGRARIPTGLFLDIPPGYEAQVRPRSGLASRHGVTVLNSPGTIDSDYRGELEIILINLGEIEFVVKNGDRIAQMVIAPVSRAELREVETLSETERGTGGFGSTGK